MIKGQIIEDPNQIIEFKSAFAHKGDKIPRTPPEMSQPDQHAPDEPFYRDSPNNYQRQQMYDDFQQPQ